jgi:hypothetical protein
MDKKIIIAKVRKELSDAGMDPEQVSFSVDPYAEEAMYLLNEWVEVQKMYSNLLITHQAMEIELNTLKGDRQPIEIKEESPEEAVAV